jgi:membrane-associated phospholipid phosphatase
MSTEAPGRIVDKASPIGATQRAARAATVGRREALRRGRTLDVVIGAGLAGFAGLLAVVSAKRSADLDLRVTQRLQRWRDPRLEGVMRAVSWPGFPPQSRLIPPGIIGAWLLLGFPIEAVAQALAWGSALVATAAKSVTNRSRPIAPQVQVVLAPLHGTSFPSGHVLTYVGMYGFLAYLLATRIRNPRPRVIAVAIPIGLIALVGPSRIHQGHHWLTDVLASYLLGASYVAALVVLYRRWLEREQRA